MRDDVAKEEEDDKKSFEEKQVEYLPKKYCKLFMDILKVGFGCGCFCYAIKLAVEDFHDNPALFDSKVYYVYISLFLFL